MLGPAAALIVLGLTLAWSVVRQGGVNPSDWDSTFLAVGCLSLAWWFRTPSLQRAPSLPIWVRIVIFALPAYILFQLIPLPLRILQGLSPARAAFVRSLAPVVPGIAAAPLTSNPPQAVFWLFTLLASAATFLLVREIGWRFSTRPWVPAIPLIVIGAFEAAVGMLQVFTNPEGGLITGTYNSHDHYAALLEMILPLAALYGLAILYRRTSRFDAPALPALAACGIWTVAALLLVAIIYSLSRGGVIATVCSLVFLAVLTIGSKLRSPKWRWASLGIIAALLLLGFVLIPPQQLIERFASVSPDMALRTAIWKESLPLVSEFRWFGAGLGGFQSNFLKYQAVMPAYTIDFAHNDYLQSLIELGLAGFAILAAIFAGILLQIVRGIVKVSETGRRLLLVACAGSFVAILLHNFVDFNMYVPANALTLSWIAGLGSVNALD